jgi:hypothetical protein
LVFCKLDELFHETLSHLNIQIRLKAGIIYKPYVNNTQIKGLCELSG